MWKRPVSLALSDMASRARRTLLMLFCCLGAVGFAPMLAGSSSSPVHAQMRKPVTVLPCFHPRVDRFTARVHPSTCNISGYRGDEFVEVPIKGMNWGHWGFNPTRAAYGVDKRDGRGVRIVAYRPITCDEGRRWYSRAVVVFPGDGSGFELRLPACGEVAAAEPEPCPTWFDRAHRSGQRMSARGPRQEG